uniref:Ribosomal protein S7 n=1 Tax=Entransia fimbriata TaxID=130991 RepID=U5YGQ0_9VIRI|nr:ribosomal protein S7 [Entransia fimbriata]AGZ90310.1 ribosomal protein S7 [Entransia fimbriata]
MAQKNIYPKRVSRNLSVPEKGSGKTPTFCSNFYRLRSKFINILMKSGKKTKAHKIFSLGVMKAPIALIRAIENVKPVVEVIKKPLGRKIIEIPSLIKPLRQESLAIRWILEGVRKRSAPISNSLLSEVKDALSLMGYARKKRDLLHKKVEASRINVRFSRFPTSPKKVLASANDVTLHLIKVRHSNPYSRSGKDSGAA